MAGRINAGRRCTPRPACEAARLQKWWPSLGCSKVKSPQQLNAGVNSLYPHDDQRENDKLITPLWGPRRARAPAWTFDTSSWEKILRKRALLMCPFRNPGIIGFNEHKNRKPSHDTHLAATIFRRSKITSFGSNGSLGMSATLLPALAVTATQNFLRKPPWL